MTSPSTTKLRDLLDLPSEVRKTDFVVRLTDGVARPEEVLPNYALTPGLLVQYDKCLQLVASAIRDRKSTASYIHGSFGSGKSHFMAVLSLLLANDTKAWDQGELHPLREKYAVLKEKKMLRLHLHMVGAKSIEEKIFPEYLAQIAKVRPEAPIPELFEDAALFQNAQVLRQEVGDERFFAKLNGGQTVDKRWGKFADEARWDAARFDEVVGHPDPEARGRLFSALVKTHFPAFARTNQFIDFDRGLGILSRHAKSAGFDAVVIFLDELILWMASRASDQTWLNTEGQKLAKLVEAQDADRPAPIISFVARQRDIAELVGDQLAGKEAQTLRDSLKWWEGRFDTVRIEDRNLPAVVQKRVVRAKSPEARKQLEAEFDRTRSGLDASWQTLLGDLGDEKSFRQVYPFSPVLIETIVALSNFLQRERTALKVLVELLVEHLEDFELGKVVPVGDVFDVLAGGEEPMDGTMREQFASAKRLYNAELLPAIQSINGTGSRDRCQRLKDGHPVSLGCSNCREMACRGDNRLVKTLLLAALVPGVRSFAALTASRLVQLNHGTIRSPLPGTEAARAVGRLRDIAAQVGKLQIGDGPDPTVRVTLEGVNIKPVLDSVRSQDNQGTRRKKLQQFLFTQLGLDADQPVIEHQLEWRGIIWRGQIRFGNVRDMEEAHFRAGGDDYRVIIDYPFDDPGRGPQEDETRISELIDQRHLDEPTLIWLPNFFTDKVQRDLGELVVVDHLLTDNNLRQAAPGLRQEDLNRARMELENLRSAKSATLIRALEAAYGFKQLNDTDHDPSLRVERNYYTLLSGHRPSSTTANTFALALQDLIFNLLKDRYPRHPNFEDRVTGGRLTKLLPIFQRLCDAESARVPLDKVELKDLRPLSELGIVTLVESSGTVRDQRFQDLDKEFAAKGIGTPTAADLRRALDPEVNGRRNFGFQPEVMDFLVQAYAMWSRRELFLGGKALREIPKLGQLPEAVELVLPAMPEQTEWQRALEVADRVLYFTINGKALNAANLRRFQDELEKRRSEVASAQAGLIATLLARRAEFYRANALRSQTAACVADFLAQLQNAEPLERIRILAQLEAKTSETAMRVHLQHSRDLAQVLNDQLVMQGLAFLLHAEEEEPRGWLNQVREAFEADEVTIELRPRLAEIARQAMEWQARKAPKRPPEPVPEPGWEVFKEGHGASVDAFSNAAGEVEGALHAAGKGAELAFSWTVKRRKS